jgi:hypothetical protein
MNIILDRNAVLVDGLIVALKQEWEFPDSRTMKIWTARQPDYSSQWIEHLYLIVQSILIEHSALISGARIVEELKRYLLPDEYKPVYLFSPHPWIISESSDTTSIRDANGKTVAVVCSFNIIGRFNAQLIVESPLMFDRLQRSNNEKDSEIVERILRED